jgi:hypothetical protein
MGVGLSSKTYFGRFVKGRKQVVVRCDMTTSPLRCRDFFTPSFAWGYHGGAPDNLAIAILEDFFGLTGGAVDARVIRLYSAFSDEMISNFGHDDAWSLTSGRVARWVSEHEQTQARPGKARPQAVEAQARAAELQPHLDELPPEAADPESLPPEAYTELHALATEPLNAGFEAEFLGAGRLEGVEA